MIITNVADLDSTAIWCVLLVVSVYLLAVSRIEQFQAQQEDELSEPPLPRVWRQRPRQSTFGNDFQELGEFDTFQAPSVHEALDVDEILRKLHREGQDALSPLGKGNAALAPAANYKLVVSLAASWRTVKTFLLRCQV